MSKNILRSPSSRFTNVLPYNLAPLTKSVTRIANNLNKKGKIQSVTLWILLSFICYRAAIITWQAFYPPEKAEIIALKKPNSFIRKITTNENIDNISALNLFGHEIKTYRQQNTDIQDAPETKLPLKLTGLVASSDHAYAIAIIEHNRHQASYGEGQSIIGTRIRIQTILPDRVIVEHNGALSTLRYGEATPPRGNKPAAITPALKQQLQKKPQQIFDYLSITPVYEEQALTGYRINPGKEPELFERFGFMPNDLAVTINGSDLRDPQQARQMLAQLPQLSEITVTVVRDGQHHNIDVSLAKDSP